MANSAAESAGASWQALEGVPAETWLRQSYGPRTYEILYKPLLIMPGFWSCLSVAFYRATIFLGTNLRLSVMC